MTAVLQPPKADALGNEAATEMRVRIFRLICGLSTVLCLAVVAPLNLFQTLPWPVHVGNLILGGVSAVCFWQSRQGRHWFGAYLVTLVGVLDFVWFPNAGSNGSVTHFYYPVLLFVMALFQGWKRWVIAFAVTANVGLLHYIEYRAPDLVTPFAGPVDRIIDLETGIVCSSIALVAVAWFILANYTREQRRVTEIASQLAVSEANYREIFNATSDALIVHAPDGHILDLNQPACALFGAERGALIGRALDEFGVVDETSGLGTVAEKFRLALGGISQVFEWRARRASAEVFHSEVALRRWVTKGENRVIASVRDITARKDQQEILRLNEERLRLAMEVSHQGWFELNPQTGQSTSSPEYIRILGYEPAEFRSDLQSWIGRLHPADREGVLKSYQEALHSGGMASLEYRQQMKSGGWKWIRSVAKVVEYDAAGRPLRVLGTHTDISERKELEAQLLHSQRLEAVGTLASGVAHDLNNILTPMLMASEVLRDSLAKPSDREFMAMVDDGARRGAAIVRQLLDFSRNLAQDRTPTDVAKLFRDLAQLMRATFPKDIQVVEAATGTAMVRAEPNQLHQAFMNLCVNARDAMPLGGMLTLGLERVAITATPGIDDGTYWAATVTDTGHGIPPEIRDRIFDPFFTTKPLGKGTGLGLASVHGIVKAHKGAIRVDSQPGRGTTFQVLLPAIAMAAAPAPVVGSTADAEPSAATPAATAAPATPARGGILVVDDDAAVRMVTSRFLKKLGYTVLAAESGLEAIEMLAVHRDEIALVITDFSMPGMDGPTLVPRLRRILPTLRVIGVSGLKQDHRAAELAALGFSDILSKPYELDDLERAVRRHFPAAPATA